MINNKRKPVTKPIILNLRRTKLQPGNLANCLAVGMILFLSSIAAIFYFYSRVDPYWPVTSSFTENTLFNDFPGESTSTGTSSPSPKPFLVSSVTFYEITPSPETNQPTLHDESSIYITDDSTIFLDGKQVSSKPDSNSTPPTPSMPTVNPKPNETPTPSIKSGSIPATTPPETKITPPPAKTEPGHNEKVIVVLDPGHGGIDPGTCSVYENGLYEKDINLGISLKLRALLEKSNISVIMTRDTDTEVYQSEQYVYSENLLERPRIANRNKATLFVSIHVNAYDIRISGAEKKNGTEVYHAGKKYGQFESKQLAEIMGNAIDKKTDTKYNGIFQRDFCVLRLCNMPALLIETAYLTNKEDHERLKSEQFRENIASGIHDGIVEILKTMGAYEKDGVWYNSAEMN